MGSRPISDRVCLSALVSVCGPAGDASRRGAINQNSLIGITGGGRRWSPERRRRPALLMNYVLHASYQRRRAPFTSPFTSITWSARRPMLSVRCAERANSHACLKLVSSDDEGGGVGAAPRRYQQHDSPIIIIPISAETVAHTFRDRCAGRATHVEPEQRRSITLDNSRTNSIRRSAESFVVCI